MTLAENRSLTETMGATAWSEEEKRGRWGQNLTPGIGVQVDTDLKATLATLDQILNEH